MSLLERLDWSRLDAQARTVALRRPAQIVASETRVAVADILDEVRLRGDEALQELGERFDRVRLEAFEISDAAFDAAVASVPVPL